MNSATFNQTELAKYNGQDGQPAYVAVDGVVYDVTGVAAWAGGKHHGNLAGQELTAVIDTKSPHGRKVLTGLTVVGQYVIN
ncbi:Cytochrome b5-like protein [Lactiplantibacillus plantarum]|uniref:cytochrome b5 domain-containing protein n=1 Tax=Lactiplantibacillus plantarum TaxID=1590 RepID=UPI0004DD863B|nr:cytochrome b5 domain-containing protein [Lactiplantibacillus plantarum]KEZ12970.1 Cytochrome b5-like protein [Lactiplantibacillus plantarum]